MKMPGFTAESALYKGIEPHQQSIHSRTTDFTGKSFVAPG